MLVLTRRIGEEIAIDGAIRVKVLAVAGNQIRLGVTAPSDIGVWRSELVGDGPMPMVRRPREATKRHEMPHGSMGT